jgi:hypothetical protein
MNRETQAPERQIGFWIALALVVGNMIGSGIFLLPANLAPYGLNAVIGWVVTIAGFQQLGIEQVGHAEAAASHFVFVRGPNAA